MIRIPVVHNDVWKTTRSRLTCAPLSYTKKMDLLHESNIPRLLSVYEYEKQKTRLVDWESPLKFKRLYAYNSDICLMCYNSDLRINNKEGCLICSHCGFICNDHPNQLLSSYSQAFAPLSGNTRQKQVIPRQHSNSIYKRCNHFKETLLRLQAKERVKITSTELCVIQAELDKRGIKATDVDPDVIRNVLRTVKLQKFYNHTYYILKYFTGIALLTLNDSQYRELYRMFVLIQSPFAEHAPFRANMISYIYIVKKFFEILDWRDAASLLPYLKSRTKVLHQDMIWKKICISVGFPFIKSLL